MGSKRSFQCEVSSSGKREKTGSTTTYFSENDLLKQLKNRFGYDAFRAGQYKVINAVMNKTNSIAIFPTGSGKSLCYQLPAMLIKDGLVLVVSPLLALMKDQMDSLRKKNLQADMLTSNLDRHERTATIQRIVGNETRVLFIAPEGLNNETTRRIIENRKIALMVIDEVHCISEWGHAFRPDYLRLEKFAKDCKADRILGLTATATKKVEDDLRRCFQVSPQNCVRTSFHRPNLSLHFRSVTKSNRDSKLLEILSEETSNPCIIYVTTQQTTVELAARLTERGFDAAAYHAGLKSDIREKVQDDFMSGTGPPIMVSTIAFGMGVDKADIRRIIHYNIPKSLEGYAQETGRAGRDGKRSRCDLLACMDDLIVLESFARCGTPTLKNLYAALLDIFVTSEGLPYPIGEKREIQLSQMATKHDLSDLTLQMLLAFLDIYHHHLETLTPQYGQFELQFIDKRKIGELPAFIRRRFLGKKEESLARFCKPKVSWAPFDLEGALQQGFSRKTVLDALNSLDDQVVIKASGVAHVYRVLSIPSSLKELARKEHVRFVEREQQEMARLGEVLALVTADACQCRLQMDYFGDPPTSDFTCQGLCQYCRTGTHVELQGQAKKNWVDPKIWKMLTDSHVPGLLFDDPTLLARFAMGYKSPRLKTLYKHQLWGTFAGLACYDSVFAMCVGICDPCWNEID